MNTGFSSLIDRPLHPVEASATSRIIIHNSASRERDAVVGLAVSEQQSGTKFAGRNADGTQPIRLVARVRTERGRQGQGWHYTPAQHNRSRPDSGPQSLIATELNAAETAGSGGKTPVESGTELYWRSDIAVSLCDSLDAASGWSYF